MIKIFVILLLISVNIYSSNPTPRQIKQHTLSPIATKTTDKSSNFSSISDSLTNSPVSKNKHSFSRISVSGKSKQLRFASKLTKDQQKKISEINKSEFEALTTRVFDYISQNSGSMKSSFDLFNFCTLYNHEVPGDIIDDWLIKNNLEGFKEGLCLCNILCKVDNGQINLEDFGYEANDDITNEQKINLLNSVVTQYALLHGKSKNEKHPLTKDVNQNLVKIIAYCRENDHKAFSKILSDWASTNSLKFDKNWCLCKLLISKTDSVKKLYNSFETEDLGSINDNGESAEDSACCCKIC